jgi:ABC-2 type transport system permease protein
VSIREKMRPMLAFFVLMIETFALASLIASEVSARTVTAILVTPARLSDLLLAKTLYGMLLAFSQALLLLLAVGAFTLSNWPLLLVTLLLGGLMFTGVAMITGAAGKDFLGTIFYGMLFLLPLAVPALAVLFPGSASLWIKVLPTYGLIQILTGATAYGDTWVNVTGYLALAAAWVAVLYAVGLFVLRRKVATL